MPQFSKKSLEQLNTCHKDLRAILWDAIQIYDFTVLCGHRGEEAQNKAYAEGNSKAKWGESKHNTMPSMAVDIAPYPIDWNNKERFAELAGIIKGLAHAKKIPIKWGGNFTSIKDMPHFELIEG